MFDVLTGPQVGASTLHERALPLMEPRVSFVRDLVQHRRDDERARAPQGTTASRSFRVADLEQSIRFLVADRPERISLVNAVNDRPEFVSDVDANRQIGSLFLPWARLASLKMNLWPITMQLQSDPIGIHGWRHCSRSTRFCSQRDA
jgi:hypothetical protein